LRKCSDNNYKLPSEVIHFGLHCGARVVRQTGSRGLVQVCLYILSLSSKLDAGREPAQSRKWEALRYAKNIVALGFGDDARVEWLRLASGASRTSGPLREQRAIKVILASQDRQVQRVRSAQQAQRVRKDLLDLRGPRGLQEIPLKSETASV